MAKKIKTTGEVITTFLSKRKTPITAVEVADRTGRNLTTVRSTLYNMTVDGEVQVVGTRKGEGRGRPANLYLAA